MIMAKRVWGKFDSGPIPDAWPYDPPPGLRVIDARSADELASHREAWTELLLQSPAASPVLSYPHVSAFLETLVALPEVWLCLFAYEGEQLVGVMPLIASRSFGAIGFSIRVFRTPHDVMHTGGVDCLTRLGREDILEVFVEYLAGTPRTWSLIRLRELADRSPSMVYFARGRTNIHAWRQSAGRENFIPIPSGYSEFHGRLSSNFKRQLKKGNKKLQALPDVQFSFREDTRSEAENLRRFEIVEDSGWKGEAGSSITASSGSSDFYLLAAERFRRQEWMEWNFVNSGDRTIGAHYGVRINRTLFLLKIAYDQEFAACSPGNLLLAKAIENACQLGDIDEINCVANCEWHKNWAMESRELHDLVILPIVPVLSQALSAVLNSNLFHRLRERVDRDAPGAPVASA